MKRRISHRAFTLVEVLATMAVVAIVLPVALRGITMTTALAGLTRERGEATALVEAKLGELQATGDWEVGVLSGDFGEQWPRYRWEAFVEDWDEADLQQLHVAVRWTSRDIEREVVLSTLVSSASATTAGAEE